MRACVVGAGAVGSHIAVRLARAGHDVSVIARGAHLEAIRARGLVLQAGEESWIAEVAADADPSGFGTQDLVIVAVKSTGLATMADMLAPLLAPGTAVLFPQNGIPWWYPVGLDDKPEPPALDLFGLGGKFLSLMTPSQIIGASIYSANEVVEPGVVKNNTPQRNQLSIGPIAPDCAVDVAGLRSALEEAGIASPALDGDIRETVWMKLLLNMSGSTIALATSNKSSISRTDPELETIYRRIVAEGLQIAAAHGFPVNHLVDIDRLVASLPDHRPSLLQDYEAGRPMEIGEIVRAPQAFAQVAGIDTPALDVLAAIVTRLARDRGLYSG
ncbi:ketopantoate reductase family protein [Oricola thermophila]|uniref:2-dehydropantoate 2-reductase n=1 Tax=Oricola thermophila TaxID=2742145 RepID=A0A6N1VLA0_9HYPH|nr:2-dehydropantoate 2-reductase [Oricola thermophila]QKV20182.1 2-dehydropantoate 2-reductase [Oricola thermophila]